MSTELTREQAQHRNDPARSTELTAELTELEAPAAIVTLFGTDDPRAVVTKASEVADVLVEVVEAKGLVVRFRDSEHMRVEGWTLLGAMLGVFAEVEYSRPIEDGFEARAFTHTLDGRRLTAGDGQCTRTERNWRTKPDYALRSMAQTRAISQAMRRALDFIVELAGYSATPAEEMEGIAPATPPAAGSAAALRAEAYAAAELRGITNEELTEISAAAGVEPGGAKPTIDQLRAILAAIEAKPIPEEAADDNFPY